MPERNVPFWKKLFFSDVLLEKSNAQKIAYIGVVTALCIVSNMFEIKFASTQFSLTIFTSILAGILSGPMPGFLAVFLGDGIGYLVNSMGFMYYWWVALACATMAFLAGIIMKVPLKFRGGGYVKLFLVCVLTFFICSVGINSTGMYWIGLPIYMPQGVIENVEAHFGGDLTFGIYLLIRFFFMGQIWNSLVNYTLLFIAVPLLNAVKPLKIKIL